MKREASSHDPVPARRGFNIYLALAIAIPAGSTAVLFNKSSHIPAIWLASGRLLIATIIIAPLAVRDSHGGNERWRWQDAGITLVPALCLALSFSWWVLGSRLAPTVDAALIGNLLPVVMPIVVFLLLRELPSAREVLASMIGVSGVVAMGAMASHHGGVGEVRGDIFCALSLLALAIYLVLARRLRRGSLWLYLAPLYGSAGVICAALAWFLEGPPPLVWGRELWLLLGLAIIPTVIGQSIYNRAMSEIRPNVLGVLNLLQCPLAGVAAWMLWGEHPTGGFWLATLGAVGAFGVLMYPMVFPAMARASKQDV
jgi:drug/metabolite transporter (DMT)-like permease